MNLLLIFSLMDLFQESEIDYITYKFFSMIFFIQEKL